MASIFTQAEISKALNISRMAITKAIRAGHIFLAKDNQIDLNHKTNSDWLKAQLNKGRVFDYDKLLKTANSTKVERLLKMKPPKIVETVKAEAEAAAKVKKQKAIKKFKPGAAAQKETQPKEPKQPKPQQTEIEFKEPAEDDTLNERKVKTEIEWKQSQIRLNRIKEDKQRGDLMPTDAVQTLFNFATEAVRASYLQEVRNVAEVFRQAADLNHNEFIEMQKNLTMAVNNVTLIFKKTLAEGVEDIINEYKEVIARGEEKL